MSDDLMQRIDAALDGTTPGPWRWVPVGSGFVITQEGPIEDPALRDVGSVMASNADKRADARLIAAAPSLLAECRDALAEKDAEIADLTASLVELHTAHSGPCCVRDGAQ